MNLLFIRGCYFNSIAGFIVLFFSPLMGIGLILFSIAMILINGFEQLAPSENQIKQQELDKFSELQRRANQQKQID